MRHEIQQGNNSPKQKLHNDNRYQISHDIQNARRHKVDQIIRKAGNTQPFVALIIIVVQQDILQLLRQRKILDDLRLFDPGQAFCAALCIRTAVRRTGQVLVQMLLYVLIFINL